MPTFSACSLSQRSPGRIIPLNNWFVSWGYNPLVNGIILGIGNESNHQGWSKHKNDLVGGSKYSNIHISIPTLVGEIRIHHHEFPRNPIKIPLKFPLNPSLMVEPFNVHQIPKTSSAPGPPCWARYHRHQRPTNIAPLPDDSVAQQRRAVYPPCSCHDSSPRAAAAQRNIWRCAVR